MQTSKTVGKWYFLLQSKIVFSELTLSWSSLGYTIGYLRNKSGVSGLNTALNTSGPELSKHEYQSISDDGDKKEEAANDDDDDFFMAPPDLGPSLVSCDQNNGIYFAATDTTIYDG